MGMHKCSFDLYIYHYSRLAFRLFYALPPLVKISLRVHILVAVALLMLCLGQNNAWCWGKILNRVVRAQTTRTKTPVLAIFLLVPLTSVSPYLNPHISAESLRMKTTKPPCFIVPIRRSISCLNNIFCFHLYFQLSWWRHDNATSTALSWSWRWILKYF
jgi:hypothetical protein